MQKPTHRPLVLTILDGFGYRKEPEHNAILEAKTPFWDTLWKNCPHALLEGSGCAVGLPNGQMGNSEVGHMNMGAGRVLAQELTRINQDIATGQFERNECILSALLKAQQNNQAIHVMGLLSPGGVHSHEQHIYALVRLAAKLKITKLYLHVFLDGRDTPPKSAMQSLNHLESLCQATRTGQICSMIGRYYAMDRDNRFDRIEKAYNLIVNGQTNYHAKHAQDGLNQAYQRGESDEFVQATSIHTDQQAPITVCDGDTVIFMNFRADRAREITQAFIDNNFTGFTRSRLPKLDRFISLTQYDSKLQAQVAYPPSSTKNMFGEYISKHHLKQLRIAETEKYAHVTYFFNGGKEQPYPGEDRILIPSPQITTYDLQPEMSAYLITERLVKEIQSKKYDVIICNYANPDMIGHTGNFQATVKAIEVIDICLGRISTTLQAIGGELIITSDHGNAEYMYDSNTQQAHTAHTSSLVPFVYMGRNASITKEKGQLADIAPSLLYLLKLPIPEEMSGSSLLKLNETC